MRNLSASSEANSDLEVIDVIQVVLIFILLYIIFYCKNSTIFSHKSRFSSDYSVAEIAEYFLSEKLVYD